MTAFVWVVLTLAVTAAAAVLGVVLAGRRLDEPTACHWVGCRRISVESVWLAHPSGGTTIRLCTGHAARLNAPPYDQMTDVSELERGLES